MRGKDSSNWSATKELVSSLYKIFGSSRLVTSGIIRVLHEVMVHQVCEKALESDTKLDHVEMEIPYIGKLSMDINNNQVVSNTIELEDEFKQQIVTAVTTGESPLVIDAEKKLVERLQRQYQSLL